MHHKLYQINRNNHSYIKERKIQIRIFGCDRTRTKSLIKSKQENVRAKVTKKDKSFKKRSILFPKQLQCWVVEPGGDPDPNLEQKKHGFHEF